MDPPPCCAACHLPARFAKRGDLVFIGHLDLMRTLDRACRRAALPISADESPFAVRQRIVSALPLPLGATSVGEWLELTLTQRLDPADVRRRLQVRRSRPRRWRGRGRGCVSGVRQQ